MAAKGFRCFSIAGLLALLCAWAVGCSPVPTQPVPTFVPRVTPTPATGEIYALERGMLSETLEARGRVVAGQEEFLFFPLGGFLMTLHAQTGDPVQAGQLIAELDAMSIEDQRLEAGYLLQVAQGNLVKAEVVSDTLRLRIDALDAQIAGLSSEVDALSVQIEQQQAADAYNLSAARDELAIASADVDNCEASLPWLTEAVPQAEARLRRAELRYEEVQYGWEVNEKTGDPIPPPGHASILNEYESAQRGVEQARANLAAQKADCQRRRSEVGRCQTELSYYTQVQGLEVRRLEANKEALDKEAERLEKEKERLEKEEEINVQAVETAGDEVRYRRTVLERREDRLAQARLMAPFDGVIVSVEKQVGEELEPYEPLGAIADPSIFRVEATVLEEDILKVAVGQSASVTLDAYAAQPFPATVSEIGSSPIVWQGKNAYTVQLEFVDPEGVPASIRMGADVTFQLVERANVLLVPESAVVRQGDLCFVTRLNGDGSLEQVEVELGVSNGQWTEVLQGLAEGERIQVP